MKNILVIDDDASVRDAFCFALADTSCDVTVAESGEEGLQRLREREMDMVYLDLKMPYMDGVETLRRIRDENFNVPVHIVTAFAEEYMEPLRRAADEGLDFSLARKPLGRGQIREITESVLGDILGEDAEMQEDCR
jgi:CheY-like chemotaxis protein